MKIVYGSPRFAALDATEQELRLAYARRDKNIHQYVLMVRVARNRYGSLHNA